MSAPNQFEVTTNAALDAYGRGYLPIPLHEREKAPRDLPQWQHLTYRDHEHVKQLFIEHAAMGLGLVLGENGGNLIDIDLDHDRARRIAPMLLPPTAMTSGRASNRQSHYWYKVTGAIPSTRRFRLPDGQTTVEFRSTGGQTVIPPSIHPSGESLRWEGEPWGGSEGPTEIDATLLMVRVASLAFATVLLDSWPTRGGRHDAYLALAGGLLRVGAKDQPTTVHPLWEAALPNLIRVIAEGSGDEDGPDVRVKETMGSTIERLNQQEMVQGWPTLARLIGGDHTELARRYAREIEGLLGHERSTVTPDYSEPEGSDASPITITLPPEERDPLGERDSSWAAVDLEPYLSGEVQMPVPSLLHRTDGEAVFYPGRVNCLYGASESGKTWVALQAVLESVGRHEKVLFVDCEDEPVSTLARLRLMGAGSDDLLQNFVYVRPESALARLMLNRWGTPLPEEQAERLRKNDRALQEVLNSLDPDLIVLDGLTVLYGLHGLDTNDAAHTDRVSGWMKNLTRNGRTSVIVIDHTPKNSARGSEPLGSQHKKAMIQGTALQVWPIDKPRPGIRAEAELIIGKDRPGGVRAISTNEETQSAALVVIDSTTPGRVIVEIRPPKHNHVTIGHDKATTDAVVDLATQRENMIAALTIQSDGMTATALLKAAGGPRIRAERALALLIDGGVVSVKKDGTRHIHTLLPGLRAVPNQSSDTD